MPNTDSFFEEGWLAVKDEADDVEKGFLDDFKRLRRNAQAMRAIENTNKVIADERMQYRFKHGDPPEPVTFPPQSEKDPNENVDICPECSVPEGDGSCSECLDQQREEGRYEELWDDKDICPECSVPEGDGSCSECLDQQREEGRYEELWDDKSESDESEIDGKEREHRKKTPEQQERNKATSDEIVDETEVVSEPKAFDPRPDDKPSMDSNITADELMATAFEQPKTPEEALYDSGEAPKGETADEWEKRMVDASDRESSPHPSSQPSKTEGSVNEEELERHTEAHAKVPKSKGDDEARTTIPKEISRVEMTDGNAYAIIDGEMIRVPFKKIVEMYQAGQWTGTGEGKRLTFDTKKAFWSPLTDPFANPFANPHFADLNAIPSPKHSQGDILLKSPSVQEKTPHEALKEGGFDVSENDDLSLLPASLTVKQGKTTGDNLSLLPSGWSDE